MAKNLKNTTNTIFISTEAATLVSIICREMPNLLKAILDYSDDKNYQKPNELPFVLLTPQQIMAAMNHPTEFVREALKAVVTLQDAVNFAAQRVDNQGNTRAEIAKIVDKIRAIKEEK